jgi:hypothetical protein
VAERLLDLRELDLFAGQRLEEPARDHAAPIDARAVDELDRLDDRPVIVRQRRIDRDLAVEPRVGLVDEVRRPRLPAEPVPRDGAVDGEPDREQHGV